MAQIKLNILSRITSLACIGITLMLLAACGGPNKDALKTVFFPPLPDEPHIQHLFSFEDTTIFEDKSLFKSLVSGMDNPDIETRLLKPYGIALYKGLLYVCDTVPNTVYRIDMANRKWEPLRGNTAAGALSKPIGLVIDERGRLYVSDVVRKEVLVYTAEGDFLKAMGKDILSKPVGVAVDNEFLYVLDFNDRLIRVLDRESGALVREIGQGAEKGDNLVQPTGIALDTKGFIYVTNAGTGKVLKLDKDGHVLFSFGKIGDFFGEFTRPKQIAVDKNGQIFVVDGGNQNVQIFDPTPTLLLPFGMPGSPHGSMNLPVGITVTTELLDFFRKYADPSFAVEELIFVTNQSGKEKISVYGLGRYTGTLPARPAAPAAPEKAVAPQKQKDDVNGAAPH